jgi:maltose alpha-D-glucosyltransferase/alpha-amylase
MAIVDEDRPWPAWLDAATSALLEEEALPAYLPRQRWFASKARTLEAVRIVDASGEIAPITLAFVEARYRDGASERYFVPLLRVAGAVRPEPRAIIVQVDGAIIADALADDEACGALLGAIESGRQVATSSGTIRASRTAAYDEARGPADLPLMTRRGNVEQSNSAVFYGDRLILKVFRKLQPGLNPDLEIGRFLSERTRFDRIPKVAGAIEYARPGGEPITLAILQELVPNRGTGWDQALGALGLHDLRLAAKDEGGEPGPDEGIGDYARSAATLGRRTAEMHLALASDPTDPAFAPEPLTGADLLALARDIRAQAEQARDVLRVRRATLPADVSARALKVLDDVPRQLARLVDLDAIADDATKIRVHGDYHLGQVLWTGDDFVILDFEGEPAKPLEARRAKQSPLKDVVGMLRSFDYAVFAALFDVARDRPGLFERLAPRARTWSDDASGAFLAAYLDTARGASFLPAEPRHRALLIGAFTLDKALYELLYELNNRPDWVRIPLEGLLALAER